MCKFLTNNIVQILNLNNIIKQLITVFLSFCNIFFVDDVDDSSYEHIFVVNVNDDNARQTKLLVFRQFPNQK